MSKIKNFIIGAGALYIVFQMFGGGDKKDTSPNSPVVPSRTEKKAQQPDQPVGFLQGSSPMRTGQPAPVANQHPYVGKWVYASNRVNMRSEPSTSSRIIQTIDRGQSVQVLNQRAGWFSVSYRNRTGWVSGQFISENPPPRQPIPKKTIRPPSPPIAPRAAPVSPSGQPVRSPYVGTCDCPYDLTRNGHRCGGRSAYSRPGGRSPICYY